MSKQDAAAAANDAARQSIAGTSDKTTFSGEEFTIYPPGAIELAEFIGEHPSMDVLFAGESGRAKAAAGGRSLIAFARLACREAVEGREDFDLLVKRATFREQIVFVRKVITMWTGDEGLGPFVRTEVTPILLAVGGKQRAEKVNGIAGLAEALLDKLINEALDDIAKMLPGISIKDSGSGSSTPSEDSSSQA